MMAKNEGQMRNMIEKLEGYVERKEFRIEHRKDKDNEVQKGRLKKCE